MAVDWKKVVEDKAAYPDDAKFTINGEEVTFGEFRRQNAASRGELEQTLTTRSAELDQREQTQRRAVDTLARVLENVSAATGLTYDQLIKGDIPQHLRQAVATATRTTTTEAGVQLADDPLYKPLLDAVINPMRNDVNIVKRGLHDAIGAYKNDHTRLAWLDWMMTGQKPDGFNAKYEDVLQMAVNKGYKDEIGFPDVARAAKEMAGPIVAKVDTEKVRKEGYEEGYQKARGEFMANLGQPQPGSGGISFESAPETGKNGKPVSIREKLQEAFSDPSIAGTLFTVQ
jgi:hypothetical protein